MQNFGVDVKVDANEDVEVDDVALPATTCSANAKARSSRDDCSTNPHIWVMSTGQKKSIEMTVGIAC